MRMGQAGCLEVGEENVSKRASQRLEKQGGMLWLKLSVYEMKWAAVLFSVYAGFQQGGLYREQSGDDPKGRTENTHKNVIVIIV